MIASSNKIQCIVSFVPDVISNHEDKNISLIASWNVIGYSSNESLNVSELKFTPSTGGTLTWSQAVSQGKVQAYLTYRENDRYKYAATQALDMDDYALRPGKAYWVRANVAGNLTLPGVGSNTGLSADYTSLTFEKDGSTLSASAADSAGWVFDNQGMADYVLYYDSITDNRYEEVCGDAIYDCTAGKETLQTWEAYWVWGNVNDMNMTADI